MLSHLLGSGDRLLAEGSPYDLIWIIGYRTDNASTQPPLWHGLNFLGKTLQTVRRLFRDRTLPSTRHQLLFPQGDPPSSRGCVLEVHPSTRQRLCPSNRSAATSLSGHTDSLPNVLSDHERRPCCYVRRLLSSAPSLARRTRALVFY